MRVALSAVRLGPIDGVLLTLDLGRRWPSRSSASSVCWSAIDLGDERVAHRLVHLDGLRSWLPPREVIEMSGTDDGACRR